MGTLLFVLKKIVSQFFMPVSLVLELLIFGLVLLWFTKRQRAGKILVTVSALLLLIGGFGILSDTFLGKLENMYPPVDVGAVRQARVEWIVVLAGGHSNDPGLPATSQLVPETIVRVNEGIRLHRAIPGSKLLMSGGSVFGTRSTADLMAELARDLGVRQKDIVLEDKSRDTEDEAELIEPMLKDKPFLLVTSAYHMPRSMMLFKGKGMQPVAAPACHFIHPDEAITPYDFFPLADEIRNWEIVAHEAMGIVVIQLKDLFR